MTRATASELGRSATVRAFEAASTWPIPVEEANPIDPPLSERQVVEEPDELGVRPTAHGQGVLDRDLDRARHARGTLLLVLYPRARFLLHAHARCRRRSRAGAAT